MPRHDELELQALFEPHVDFIAVSRHLSEAGVPNYWTVDLKPGTYVLVCFIPDAKDGKPHLAHGMMKVVEIQ